MKIGEIDYDLKPSDYKLKLFKPNRQDSLGNLKDIDDVVYRLNSGRVNELSFTIPSKIERNHQLIDNPMIERIKHRYMVKFSYRNKEEWFIFYRENKKLSNNGKFITYELLGSANSIADKTIRSYVAESKNLYEMIVDILGETVWTIDYVHPQFMNKYRQHEIGSQNALEALYDIAKKFNALVLWDTVNESVRFETPENLGINKGFKLKEGKYLESFDVKTDSSEMVTRMNVYGAEGLTFRRLTPTGVNYLEDFSYFMYPFQRVGDTVIEHSHYMSDSLCIALEDYSELLSSNQSQFDNLSNQLTVKQDELQQLEQQLSVLDTQLVTLYDQLDVLNQTGQGQSASHATVVAQINSKKTEITNKQSQINAKNSEIATLNSSITTLRNTLRVESNFTADQLKELNYFVISKDYTNDTIVDEEDLLLDGIEAFEKVRIPKLSVTMNLYNFLENIESQNDWDKLELHDIVTLYSERLKVNIEARIIEIQFNLTSKDINLTIANEIEISDNTQKMLDMIYQSNNTSTQVSLDKWKWNLIEQTNTMVNQMYYGDIEAVRQRILAGFEQNVTIDERGIRVRSPQNSNEMLIMQNGILALSKNGGLNWQTAITPDGVTAERLIGLIILGSQLVIEDENGIIKIQGSKQTIFDQNGVARVELGRYETNKYGIRINSGSLEIVGGITASHMSNQLYNDLQYNDAPLRADLRLTAPLPSSITLNSNGITATTANSSNFARMDYRGLYIQGGAIDIRTGVASNRGVIFDGNGIKGYNSSGGQTFGLDTNGNFFANNGTFSGSLVSAGGTFSGSLSGVSGSFSGSLSGANITGATGTFTGTLSGNSISGATITGSTIVSAHPSYGEVRISGGEFRVANSSLTQYLYLFSGYMSFGTNMGIDLEISPSAIRTLNGNTMYFYGNFNFSGASVSGLSVSNATYATSAGNADTVDGYHASSFALSSHSHTNYLSLGSSSQFGASISWNSQGTMTVSLPSGSSFRYFKD